MPASPTGLSADVQRLVDEGYTVEIVGQYLIVDNVPYVPAAGVVARAAIISEYEEKDGVGQVNGRHVVWFTGGVPCTPDGQSLQHVLCVDTNAAVIAGRQVRCRLSYKSERPETLANFYSKMTHYVRKLESYAQAIDPSAIASGKGSITVRQPRSVFHYPNAAIAREGLDAYEDKLKLNKIAIVGLGGTGSYILDALAKTPVEHIHLYDDDVVKPATVYRMPGALTVDEAQREVRKTDCFQELYSRMRVGIESHPYRIDMTNVHELDDCQYVFIAVDHGPSRALIARRLSEKDVPFIDVGMGVDKVPDEAKLLSRARITAVGARTKALVDTLPVADDQEDELYNNIQVVELNALNAMLAVIIYKQKLGFYSEELVVDELRYISAWQRLSHAALQST
jgi:hypothetical protein